MPAPSGTDKVTMLRLSLGARVVSISSTVAAVARRHRGAGTGRYACLVLLLVAGCGADRDYQTAERANTVVAFDDYLRLHPDGAHAREAREHLATLLEEREWQRAHAADTPDAYQQYLRGYPAGQHVHDALAAISNLKLAATPTTEAAGQAPPGGASPMVGSAGPAAAAGTAKGAIARATSPAPGAAATSGASELASAPTAVTPPVRAAGAVTASDRPDSTHGFRVQLGAFAGGSHAATAAWQHLVRKHPDLATRHPLIAAARTAGGHQVYRLQLGGFSRESAQALCRALGTAHDPCMVVPPVKPARS